MLDLKETMGITDKILFNYFKWRQKKIDAVIASPVQYQNKVLLSIIQRNKGSEWGKKFGFNSITNVDDYKKNMPLVNYSDVYPYIKRMMHKEQNLIVSEPINWFAKSSGTSTGRSKYIPVSKSFLKEGHLKCAWDAASFIYNEDPMAKLFKDRSLIMGGSLESINDYQIAGDISAIILNNFPKIGRRFYTPDFETALLPNWDEKINRIAEITSKQDVTLLAGVPSWTIVLLKAILDKSGKDNISEVWPNLRSYLHGGVGFGPYKSTFKKLIPSNKLVYREVYNASEGYFSIQNNKDQDGMLLLCDHGIYYEFIPEPQVSYENPDVLNLNDLEIGKNYALVITTMDGLYRYRIGDVVQLVDKFPFKIKVVGRENEMINVFGEEVSVLNTDMALAKVCDKLQISASQYTVGPEYMTENKAGKHIWLIEFNQEPKNLNNFKIQLDKELQNINSDYEAKRSKNMALINLDVLVAKKGTFEKWLRQKGKYGGQNKVPRLKNDNTLINDILTIR